jgi:RNA polymerase sigma factor for flagellar operon FliA
MERSPAHECEAAREALIRRYLPLVRRIAGMHRRRLPVGIDLDDVRSWGTFGLLAAVDRFDPARADLFAAYARKRIRGAILDQLRQSEWMPRSVRDKAEEVARSARELEARFGRTATEDEMAWALGLPVARYHALLGRIAPVAMVGLDEVQGTPETGTGPLDAMLHREETRLLSDAIRRLPEREQVLLSLYYRDELTMREIGAVLGVTESRVCQVHAQALRSLRAQLKIRGETTERNPEGAWARSGHETSHVTPHGVRDASRGSGSAYAPGSTRSTRTRRLVRSSPRSAVSGRA